VDHGWWSATAAVVDSTGNGYEECEGAGHD
jgi:hypothetical protein